MTEALYERAEIFFAAKNLVDKDLFSKSDPFAVLFRKNDDGQWVEVGRTEVIQDNLNPTWDARFVLEYHFEVVQELKVAVYDEDSKGNPDLSRHDLLGEGVFTLSNLMTSRGQGLAIELQRGKRAHRGTLIVRGESVHNTRDILRVQFKGTKLANKDGLFGRSDPYIVAYKLREDNSWVRVWQSEVIDNNLNPTWGIAEIPLQQLCNGDIDRPVKFEIFDYDNPQRSETMGEIETSVRALVDNPSRSYDVIEIAKKSKKSYKNSGTLTTTIAQIEHRPLFMDYLKGGCQVSLVVGIDFTGSNGHPLDAGSLHYIDPSRRTKNQYQMAIATVGRVLEEYDSDKKFAMFGFGAVVEGNISHCFSIVPPNEREVDGVSGLLNAYENVVTRVQFSGPTLFAPLLRNAIARAATPTPHQQYHILLILCDGVINDMPATIDALVEASTLPLSIIIVGVGDADFTDMNRLDGDDGLLRNSRGEPAARDIVQFVPFSKYGASRVSELAKEVLEEIPAQFLSYMAAKGIAPNPPTSAPSGEFDAPPAYEESKQAV